MLRRLQDLPDYRLAEGEPDIRGWSVNDRSGMKIGEIDSLLVDTEHDHEDQRGYLPIRYAGLRANDQVRLIPIGLIDLNETRKVATLRETGTLDTTRFPVYGESGAMTTGAQTFSNLFREPKVNYERAEFKRTRARERELEFAGTEPERPEEGHETLADKLRNKVEDWKRKE